MMSPNIGMSLAQMSGELSSPITLEDIRLLIMCFTPEDKYVFAGRITKDIEKATGAYISPDGIKDIIARDLGMIKRLWTPNGWKYIRRLTLDDYMG